VDVMHALYLAQIGLRGRPCRMISGVLAGSTRAAATAACGLRVDPGS
jgi:hypothetical protein